MKNWLATAFFCMASVSGLALYECESACESIGLGSGGYLCGGGGGGPRRGVFRDIVSDYSYNGNATDCWGQDNNIDPISMILRGPPVPGPVNDNYWARLHLDAHGLEKDAGVGDQRFWRDDGFCELNDIGQASSGSLSSRWHVRGYTQRWATDPYAMDATIHALTPHWDELTSSGGCGVINHYVPEDFYNDGQNISGFVAARNHIAAEWLASGHHDVIAIYNFRNIDELVQCNEQRPQSDGFVYHLY